MRTKTGRKINKRDRPTEDSDAGIVRHLFNRNLIMIFKKLNNQVEEFGRKIAKKHGMEILELEIQRPQWSLDGCNIH